MNNQLIMEKISTNQVVEDLTRFGKNLTRYSVTNLSIRFIYKKKGKNPHL